MSDFPLKARFVAQIALLFLLIIMIQGWVEYLLGETSIEKFWLSTLFFGTGITIWTGFSPLLYKQFYFLRRSIRPVQVLALVLILNGLFIATLHQILNNSIYHLVTSGEERWNVGQLVSGLIEHLPQGLFARTLEYWLVILLLLFFSYSKLNEKYALDFRNFLRKILSRGNERDGKLEKIEFKDKGALYSIPVKDVIWFESNGNYVNIHCSHQKFIYRQTMSHLNERLDEEVFLRVHRSYLVNIDCIQEINYKRNGEYKIVLTNSTILISGRSYQNNVLKLLRTTSRLVLSTTL